MASTLTLLLLIIFSISLHVSNATFVLPILKDTKNSQYFTTFLVGTPPSTRVYLVIDLSNKWSWFTCDLYGYNNTTNPSITSYNVPCNSRKCERYAGQGNFCVDDKCGVYAYTRWSNGLYAVALHQDTTTLYKLTQQNSLAQLTKTSLPHFPFSCADKGPLKGLSPYTKGVITLAKVPNSFHSQISSTFKTPRKFSLCLPTSFSRGYNGAIYFGGTPNYLSKSLITTPFIVNPNSTALIYSIGEASVEYFIKVTSIEVDKTPIRFSSSLLSFDKNGIGGTKISTLDPYTVLHSSIYKALIDVFVSKATAMKMTRVAPVAPFGACFNAKSVVNSAKTGFNVPVIDMILDGKSSLLHNKNNARWRIYGANSMVKVSDDVLCLGFVDGGLESRTSIVIGGKQMEDNLVEFDLESNKLGITSSLLRMGTSCSNFKGI
ncbi:probable aspartic proteinase GIP2 [Beta vulgaris subsp. vulgaris]|uniref:probable aspartic proteinase GIP2 n=1 Tax=Beta vulgaris subsp. vulgaris TaxID=3555 RepID=UPI00053FE82A|nr:probable aspartic proteinase GIP2 [Beta vulgaris subsp. vulgaris]